MKFFAALAAVMVIVSAKIGVMDKNIHATKPVINKHIGGVWINRFYKMQQMNKWHIVEIKSYANDMALWTNKAGVKWALKIQVHLETGTHNIVGFSCGKNPYWNKGFRAVAFVFAKNAAPAYVTGPFKEQYVMINHKF